MMNQCYKKKIPAHYKQLLERLNIQRCCGDFCDVTVVIQRMRFRAHRCILSAASKKLHVLVNLMKPLSRKHGGLGEELRIQEVSPQGFKIVLEYIYTGLLWIPGDCLNDVSSTALYLEMDDVIHCCANFTLPQSSMGHNTLSSKESDIMSPSSVSEDGEDSQDDDVDCVNDSASNAGGNNGVSLSTKLPRLPVLDSSLGGLLNSNSGANNINQNTLNANHSAGNSGNSAGNIGAASSSFTGIGNSQTEESNIDQDNQQNNCSTYPDQDALSEISVQNEDDMMYQVASTQVAATGRSGTQSGSDYPYNHYVPPIEQTFSPRPMAKVMTSHMTILPSMLSSQAFFQEPGQFPIDAAYYVSQPGQFYPSNYVQQQPQEQGRGDYIGDQNVSASQTYNNQSFSGNESERQRLVPENYHSSNILSSANTAYQQHSSSNVNYTSSVDYGDNNNPVYGDINDLHMGTGVDRELQHIHNNAYMNQNVSTKGNTSQMIPTDIKQYSRTNRFSEVKTDSSKPPTESNSQRYISISPVSCQETGSDHPFIEAISPYNPDTEMPVPTPQDQMPPLSKNTGNSFNNSTSSSFTSSSDSQKEANNRTLTNQSSSEIPKSIGFSSTTSTVSGSTSTSSSHFSSRPAARMPPKKAGYRGIESDYNRHFNIFADQYSKPNDNLNNSYTDNKDYKSQSSNHMEKNVKPEPVSHRQNDQRVPNENQSANNINHRSNQMASCIANQISGSSSESKVDRNLPLQNVPSNQYVKNQNVSNEIQYMNDVKNPGNNSVGLQHGNTNYSGAVQTGNETYTHGVHIQTKKMAASQAAKAAIQANAAASSSGQNNGNSSVSGVPQTTNNRQSASSVNKTSNLNSYSNVQEFGPINNRINPCNGQQQLQRLPLSLEQSNLYIPENEQTDSSNKTTGAGGLTPTKNNNNMADLVDSIEDYLRLIDHSSEHSSPTKSSNYHHMTVCNTGGSNSTQTASGTSQQYNNSSIQNGLNGSYSGQELGLQGNGSSTAVSNNYPMNGNATSGPSSHSQGTSSNNHSVNGVNSVSYSVEDVRKTILNVLSQECFDDDSGLSSGSKDNTSASTLSFKKQENVPLTTLLKMVPFDKTRPTDTSLPGSSSCNSNLTQYADVSSSQENVDRFMNGSAAGTAATRFNDEDDLVRHFEDIDSASDDGSDYNLVIDFDKEIHEEDEVEYSSASMLKGSCSNNNKPVASFTKGSSDSSNYRGKLASKLRTMEMLDNNTQKETLLKDGKKESNVPKEEAVDGHKEAAGVAGSSDSKGLPKRKRQPIKIPKYALTAEYREDSEARLGNRSGHRHSDEPHIVKPLKKRIKLKLLMKKIQEDNITVTRHMLKKKVPNRHIKYVCEMCDREFWDKYKAFAEHMKDHSRNELHFCNVCGKGYRRLEDLSKHRSTNHSLHSFQCKDCKEVFDNAVLYKKHCVNDHKNNRPFYCLFEGCKYSTERFNTLEKHTLIHGEEKQFTCPHCSTQFSQPNGLRAHLVSCMNMQTYVCPICSKTFNRNQGLKDHLLCHSGVKKHTCKDCGSSFNDVRNYKRHCRTHNDEQKFACRHCDSKFNYSHVLKRHIVKKHPDKEQVEFGKKGAKNKESVLIKNYVD